MSEKAPPPPESAGQAFLRLLPLLLLTTFLCYNRPGQNPQYLVKGCGANLHKLSVKVERNRLGSEDKLYALTLKDVYGKTEIPECPAAGDDTYTAGYTVSEDRASYVLVCKGTHHAKAALPADYPRVKFSVEEAKKAKSAPSPAGSPSPVIEATPTPSGTPSPTAEGSPTPSPEVSTSPTPAVSETPAAASPTPTPSP